MENVLLGCGGQCINIKGSVHFQLIFQCVCFKLFKSNMFLKVMSKLVQENLKRNTDIFFGFNQLCTFK